MASHGTRYMYGKGCRCPACSQAQNEYVKAWMNTSKGKAIRDKHRSKRLALLAFLKDKPCADCHDFFPPYVMEFDHLYDKEFNIGSGARLSMVALMAEVEKCEVVCANCHRIRTWERAAAT